MVFMLAHNLRHMLKQVNTSLRKYAELVVLIVIHDYTYIDKNKLQLTLHHFMIFQHNLNND